LEAPRVFKIAARTRVRGIVKKRARPRRARRSHNDQVEVGSTNLFKEGIATSLGKQVVVISPSENIHVDEFKLAMGIMLAIESLSDFVHACLKVGRAFFPSKKVKNLKTWRRAGWTGGRRRNSSTATFLPDGRRDLSCRT